jgi:hypothetical protein
MSQQNKGFPRKFLWGTKVVTIGNGIYVIDESNDMAMPLVDYLDALREEMGTARRTFLDDFRQDSDI